MIPSGGITGSTAHAASAVPVANATAVPAISTIAPQFERRCLPFILPRSRRRIGIKIITSSFQTRPLSFLLRGTFNRQSTLLPLLFLFFWGELCFLACLDRRPATAAVEDDADAELPAPDADAAPPIS